MVHRERGRSDVVLTGLGTVLADDPELTPRHGHVRRMPVRVVADSLARTPPDARLLRTRAAGPVVIAVREDALGDEAVARRAEGLRDAGAEILPVPRDPAAAADPSPRATPPVGDGAGSIDLEVLLRRLADRGAARVLVEAGGILLGRLFAEELVQEAWVFTGPRLLGDGGATPPVAGFLPARIDDGVPMRLWDLRRRGEDAVARWRVGPRPDVERG